jgi:HlyD family secretion protein
MLGDRPGRGFAGRALYVAVVVALAVSASFLYAYRRGGPARELRDVTRRTVRQSVTAIGRVEPLTTVEVRSKANGIVRALSADVGDVVRKGDVLAELDKDYPLTFQREASAQARMAEAERDAVLAQVRQALIEADTQVVELLKADCQRQLELFAQGLVSRQTLENCQRQLVIAQTGLSVKRAEHDVLKVKVEQAEARVRAARAALDRAQEDLRNTTILAPIDGVVLTRDVEKGSAVSSILNQGVMATRLFTIGDARTVYVDGQVDEVDVAKIRVGMPSQIRIESLPGEEFHGLVTRIAPMADKIENVTTFRVRVSIDDPSRHLRSRMSASAQLIVEEAKDVLTVPESCIRYGPDGVAHVRVYDERAPGRERIQDLRVGVTDGSFRQVVTGVGDGDRLFLQ